MAILVSDTSVLIDLERGELLEHAFSCGLVMAVPDLLYQNELEEANGSYLRALGLSVVPLTPNELEFAQAINGQRPSLSLPDCFALSCALRQNHLLLTGDMNLRNEATARNVQVYGLLWVLDQMEASGEISFAMLHAGLGKITAHPRCRLPKEEVKVRLSRWSK